MEGGSPVHGAMVPDSSSKANKKVQHTAHKGQSGAGLGAPSSWCVPLGKFSASGRENARPESGRGVAKKELSQTKESHESLIVKVARGGFEPPTRGFSIRCSTN